MQNFRIFGRFDYIHVNICQIIFPAKSLDGRKILLSLCLRTSLNKRGIAQLSRKGNKIGSKEKQKANENTSKRNKQLTKIKQKQP
ncbi:MAG: hypothetical protein IIW52_03580 [Alistipes sp.]|nr:hypothetical protein [Alistipes sp.]